MASTSGKRQKGLSEFQEFGFQPKRQKSGEARLESKTQWHNVAVFKPWLQDTVNSYVRKGTRLFIQGHIDYSNYIDQEGIKRFSTSIIPDSVIILSQPVSMEEETGY